jgi:hypothetical protein
MFWRDKAGRGWYWEVDELGEHRLSTTRYAWARADVLAGSRLARLRLRSSRVFVGERRLDSTTLRRAIDPSMGSPPWKRGANLEATLRYWDSNNERIGIRAEIVKAYAKRAGLGGRRKSSRTMQARPAVMVTRDRASSL